MNHSKSLLVLQLGGGVPCSTNSIPLSTIASQKGGSMEPQEPPLNPPLCIKVMNTANYVIVTPYKAGDALECHPFITTIHSV